MKVIPLKDVERHGLNFEVDGHTYQMTFTECNGIMAVTIVRDGVEIISGRRICAVQPLIPEGRLELGNFVFQSFNRLPYFNKFGSGDVLYYLDPDEMVEFRAWENSFTESIRLSSPLVNYVPNHLALPRYLKFTRNCPAHYFRGTEEISVGPNEPRIVNSSSLLLEEFGRNLLMRNDEFSNSNSATIKRHSEDLGKLPTWALNYTMMESGEVGNTNLGNSVGDNTGIDWKSGNYYSASIIFSPSENPGDGKQRLRLRATKPDGSFLGDTVCDIFNQTTDHVSSSSKAIGVTRSACYRILENRDFYRFEIEGYLPVDAGRLHFNFVGGPNPCSFVFTQPQIRSLTPGSEINTSGMDLPGIRDEETLEYTLDDAQWMCVEYVQGGKSYREIKPYNKLRGRDIKGLLTRWVVWNREPTWEEKSNLGAFNATAETTDWHRTTR